MDNQIFDQNAKTYHGDNVAGDVQGTDAYGYAGELSAADIYNILDNIHTNNLDTGDGKLLPLLSQWMEELLKLYPDMERY